MSKYLSFSMVFVLTIILYGCSTITIPDIPNRPHEEQNDSSSFAKIEVELDHGIDGDTVSVFYNGKEESVRFLLIDTPETSHPRLGKQPFGQEAKEFTNRLIQQANTIELEFDIGANRDKYGRLLAYVYVDGKMLQEELLKEGLARVAYVYPPNTRYVDEFNALQRTAQKEGKGIWEIEDYVREDGFNSEVIESDTNTDSISSDCNIKGNINSSSEKIYHTPDSPWYEKTKPEVMFCTEEEAVKAGFRPPKQ
ncbi:thermonuclease family protein [Bacillus luteolus]|uniref:Thermonuclease family protein n=1 Tax=Litchfieldia luteola TaxID=682179 RepID=A0ABR9QPU8_9BACI|nr:thermonuclease family protein [Cytobacillus luteolus]MBE4910535.1 thermonuclease family protein [Cytobacillus luteolus]MBP1943712.1 micrococcal nuclease [Cytobacillus luteolus]